MSTCISQGWLPPDDLPLLTSCTAVNLNSTKRARCKQGEILARGKRDDGQGEVVVPLL